MEPIIQIYDVHKYFGRVHALQGVSLNVNKGEVVVIVGPSGSGKSTLLRCINRLEEYDKGKIIVDGILWIAHKILMQYAAKWAWYFNLLICFHT